MKNTQAKTRKIEQPYEIWVCDSSELGRIEYRVLKKWQAPDKEASNPYARWFCATKSDATFGTWELGDGYVSEIKDRAYKVYDETIDGPKTFNK